MSEYTPSLEHLRDTYADLGISGNKVSQFEAEFDRAIAKVRAKAKAEALREAAGELTGVIEDVQSGNRPNSVEWQTGALAMRDWLRATS